MTQQGSQGVQSAGQETGHVTDAQQRPQSEQCTWQGTSQVDSVLGDVTGSVAP